MGVIWGYFVIPETKGVPLEEMAAILGDDDDVVVYMKDIHVDHNTRQLVVDRQRNAELARVVTELYKPNVEHFEGVKSAGGTSEDEVLSTKEEV